MRLGKLLLGLVLFGVGLWLGLVAGLGVGPWDVLTGGLAELLGTSFGRKRAQPPMLTSSMRSVSSMSGISGWRSRTTGVLRASGRTR